MFLTVKTDDTTMAINLGNDSESISKLINMFEQNAKFIKQDYSKVSFIKPEMTVQLGKEIDFSSKYSYSDEVSILKVCAEDSVVGCVNADNNGFIVLEQIKSEYKKLIQERDNRIKTLNAEKDVLKSRLSELEVALEQISQESEQTSNNPCEEN